ncbi:MAG: hypothetical protein R3181_12350 [Rubricoccaceae bacterium]|nr:hypothetical protein [Rubricoccaceae bacterium]
MRTFLLLPVLLLAACVGGADPEDAVLELDGEIAEPDASDPTLAPDGELAPSTDLAPEEGLRPSRGLAPDDSLTDVLPSGPAY